MDSVLILGISAFYHDSAVALVRDGRIVAAAQEERFTRIKHDAAFPANALRWCLSGIPFKIDAAHHEHLQRILIPDEADATDPDWRTPFLMQVSPVASISEAYEALTDRPLVTDAGTHSRAAAP